MYIKKWEFFESEIDKLELQGLSYKLERVSAKAMTLKTSENRALLQYCNTIVTDINYNRKTIALNTGGWFSVTTKKHMNEQLVSVWYYIQQFQYEWYVIKKGTIGITGKKDLASKLNKGEVKHFDKHNITINY